MNEQGQETGVGGRVTGRWRKATASGDKGGCFEFAPSTVGVAVRDSKLGDASPILHFTSHELRCMLDGAKAGEFDDLL